MDALNGKHSLNHRLTACFFTALLFVLFLKSSVYAEIWPDTDTSSSHHTIKDFSEMVGLSKAQCEANVHFEGNEFSYSYAKDDDYCLEGLYGIAEWSLDENGYVETAVWSCYEADSGIYVLRECAESELGDPSEYGEYDLTIWRLPDRTVDINIHEPPAVVRVMRSPDAPLPQPAYDIDTAYGLVLDQYAEAMAKAQEDPGSVRESDFPDVNINMVIQCMTGFITAEDLCFSRLDIDGNGTEELIIFARGMERKSLVQVYTFSDGRVISLINNPSPGYRNFSSLASDGIIFCEEYGGAVGQYAIVEYIFSPDGLSLLTNQIYSVTDGDMSWYEEMHPDAELEYTVITAGASYENVQGAAPAENQETTDYPVSEERDILKAGTEGNAAVYVKIPEYEQANVRKPDGSALDVYYWSEISSDYESVDLHLTVNGAVYQAQLSGVFDPSLVALYWMDMGQGYDYFTGVLCGEGEYYATSILAINESGLTVLGPFGGNPDFQAVFDDGVIGVAERTWYGDKSNGQIFLYRTIQITGASYTVLSEDVGRVIHRGAWDDPEENTYALGYTYTIDNPLSVYQDVDRNEYLGSLPGGTEISLERFSLGTNYEFGGQEYVYYVTGGGISGWTDMDRLRESSNNFLLAA